MAEFSAADSHILPSESVSAPGRPPCRLSWVQRRPRNPGEAAPPPPVGAEEAPEPLGRTFLDPLVPGSCRIPVASVRSCGPCRGRPGSGGSVWPRVCPGSGAHVLLCTWSWAVWNPPRLCQAYTTGAEEGSGPWGAKEASQEFYSRFLYFYNSDVNFKMQFNFTVITFST